MTCPVRARISLPALEHNLQRVRQYAPHGKIMAVVKANGYGHGLVPVACALAAADGFGVARLEEALALRDAGIETPITLLEGCHDASELRQATDPLAVPDVHFRQTLFRASIPVRSTVIQAAFFHRHESDDARGVADQCQID